MAFYFPLILTLVVLLTGIVTLLDKLLWEPKRKHAADNVNAGIKIPKFIEYSRSFFPVLLIVLLIRSFIFQPYRVPTGSLEPTILPGDMLVVSQFSYGLRLPVIHKKIINIGEPKRGDIVVFRNPENPKMDLVKRVIGVPGDHIQYRDKVLYINGQQAEQQFIASTVDHEIEQPVIEKQENLLGIKHNIFIWPIGGDNRSYDVTVPDGNYFMMGDNRDDSGDSRYWGFAPEANIIGKAKYIILSWDSQKHQIRSQRLFKSIASG
jgi:signal peptidase I